MLPPLATRKAEDGGILSRSGRPWRELAVDTRPSDFIAHELGLIGGQLASGASLTPLLPSSASASKPLQRGSKGTRSLPVLPSHTDPLSKVTLRLGRRRPLYVKPREVRAGRSSSLNIGSASPHSASTRGPPSRDPKEPSSQKHAQALQLLRSMSVVERARPSSSVGVAPPHMGKCLGLANPSKAYSRGSCDRL